MAPGLTNKMLIILFASSPQALSLNPPEKRITDSRINADYKTYEAQQAEIKRLNDTGKFPVASYALAKSQCWLDVSFHEYTRNDRSAFPQESLTEAAKITRELSETGASLSAQETPLVNKAQRLRPDLWEALTKLKGDAGYACVQRQVACAEVELVHAGNENNQHLVGKSWRHSKPYIQIAEDLIADAQQAKQECTPLPQVAVVAPVVAPAVVAPEVVATPALVIAPVVKRIEVMQLSANVLFNHDKRTMDQARAMTVDRLNELVKRVKAEGVTLKSLTLTGHADLTKLNGKQDYNEKLSQDRTQAVKSYLESKGVVGVNIGTVAKSDQVPVEACTGKFVSRAEYHECLLPNRRVEVSAEIQR